MTMTTESIAVTNEATSLAPTAGSYYSCIRCGGVWPGDEPPHTCEWNMSTTKLTMSTCCGDDHGDPVWHAFEVINASGVLLLAGLICPACVATPGLNAVIHSALVKAMRAEQNAN